MKQKLEITKEEALKLYPEASEALKSIFESTFGVETFKPKSIIDKIQTLEDVYNLLGLTHGYPIPYPVDREERSVAAHAILQNVAKAYNEGWVAKWEDASQYKYYPYLCVLSDGVVSVDCSCWFARHCAPAGLAFKSKELALDAIGKFRSLYNDYLMVS